MHGAQLEAERGDAPPEPQDVHVEGVAGGGGVGPGPTGQGVAADDGAEPLGEGAGEGVLDPGKRDPAAAEQWRSPSSSRWGTAVVPWARTDQVSEPYADPLADAMIKELRRSCAEFGITFFDRSTGKQGIVHIVGPEQGITQPGTTIACGDSHTSTHGAFGAIAFGIGTTQIATSSRPRRWRSSARQVRRIEVNGRLRPGVYAKDVILHIIARSASTAARGTPTSTPARCSTGSRWRSG